MDSYYGKNELLGGAAITVDSNVTAQAVSNVFPITAGGSKAMRVDVPVTITDTTGTIVLALQTSVDGGTTWVAAYTAADQAATGTVTFEHNIYDGSDTLLPSLGRVVLTTSSADVDMTVDAVHVHQER